MATIPTMAGIGPSSTLLTPRAEAVQRTVVVQERLFAYESPILGHGAEVLPRRVWRVAALDKELLHLLVPLFDLRFVAVQSEIARGHHVPIADPFDEYLVEEAMQPGICDHC